MKSFLKKKKWNPLRVICVLPQTPPIILVIKEWRGGWLLKFPFYFQAPFKVVFKRVSSDAYSGQNLYSAWPFLPGMKLYLKENKMDFYVSLLRVLLNSVWVLFEGRGPGRTDREVVWAPGPRAQEELPLPHLQTRPKSSLETQLRTDLHSLLTENGSCAT